MVITNDNYAFIDIYYIFIFEEETNEIQPHKTPFDCPACRLSVALGNRLHNLPILTILCHPRQIPQ